MPVHAVVTANHPLVRFIGSDDMQQNQALFDVWLKTLPKWAENTTPYLFVHTPDIGQVYFLVHALWPALQSVFPDLGKEPAIPKQNTLF